MSIKLSAYTTIQTGGDANLAEIVTDSSKLTVLGGETVIGRGSKLLVSDGGVQGRVLVMRNEKAEVRGNLVVAESGATLPKLSRIAEEAGLSGLEWACCIPGSLGGSIIMNAGAYGGEISDLLVSADVLTPSGRVTVALRDLEPTYRHMKGMPCGVIVSATLRLSASDRETVSKRVRELTEQRKAAQPVGRTFGSTFRKIRGMSAGYFIEKAGLKGFRIGGAYISEKHANFIINEGESAADVRALIDTVKLKVYAELGERLTEEVIYIGEF